jgi:hypothetical protein
MKTMMRRRWVPVILAAALAATPAFASPVPARGISPEQMVQIMVKRGLPAKIGKDSDGTLIISSRVIDVNFDVYFYQCAAGYCRDIQFAAGWSDANTTPERVNEWNTTKRFVRAYWKSGNVLWAEEDARISRGTTENIDEQLALWPQMLSEFKQFMHF